ncbi:hypothetical protein BC828DRAFT_98242 [Blastocladiella britannica]|nr:hypothetical protein BC828DRAFT_98242 [Blastocladiella britannica]
MPQSTDPLSSSAHLASSNAGRAPAPAQPGAAPSDPHAAALASIPGRERAVPAAIPAAAAVPGARNGVRGGELTLQSDAYANKVNTLKDKALYRFEREMNLTQFKDLMEVFQRKAANGGRLTIAQFKDEFAKILQKEMTGDQITLMLMRIGIRGEFVSWEAFGNFMMQRAQEQSKQRESEEQEATLFVVAQRLTALGYPIPQPTPHREMICGVIYLPFQQRFVSVSRDGGMCHWSEQFKLQRCYTDIIHGHVSSLSDTPSGQQAQQFQSLQRQSKQCWISTFLLLQDVKKWVFATDQHELSFHDLGTLHAQCKLKLPANVLAMDYYRENLWEPPVPAETRAAAVPTSGPADSSTTATSAAGAAGAAAPAADINLTTSAPNSTTATVSAATPLSASATSEQYAKEATLFLGDDMGDLTIITFDPEAIFNPNSSTMLTAAKGTVVQLEKRHFTSIVKRKVHGDWVTRVQYHKDFKAVYSCSPDPKDSLVAGTLMPGGKWKFLSTSVNKGVNAFAICRFPVALITVGADRKVRLWNPRRIANPQASMRGHAAPILDVQVQQSLGLCVTLSSDKVIKVWDIRKMACVQTLSQNADILHRPDDLLGFIHVTATAKGTIRLFTGSSTICEYVMLDAVTAKQNKTHLTPIKHVSYNPVCKMVTTVSEDSVMQVWEVQNGSLTFKLEDSQSPREITCIGFDNFSGYRRMLVGTGDGMIQLCSIEGHVLCEMRKRDKCEATCVLHVDCPEGRFFIAGGWQCRLYLFPDDAKSEATFMYPSETWSNTEDDGHLRDGRNDDIISMTFVKPHFLCYSTLRGDIWVRSMAGLLMGVMHPPEMYTIPAWNRSVEKLVSLRPVVAHRHVIENPLASKAETPASPRSAVPLAPITDTAHVASCGMDGTIRFWDITTLTQVHAFDVPGVATMALSPDGDQLLVGTTAGQVEVYSLTTPEPKLLVRWQAHVSGISGLETMARADVVVAEPSTTDNNYDSRDNQQYFIISVSADHNARCWTSDGEYIGTFGQPTPWDLSNRTTWRHPSKPGDVCDMVRSAEARAAAIAEGIPLQAITPAKDHGATIEKDLDDGDMRVLLSRPSTRGGSNKREIGQISQSVASAQRRSGKSRPGTTHHTLTGESDATLVISEPGSSVQLSSSSFESLMEGNGSKADLSIRTTTSRPSSSVATRAPPKPHKSALRRSHVAAASPSGGVSAAAAARSVASGLRQVRMGLVNSNNGGSGALDGGERRPSAPMKTSARVRHVPVRQKTAELVRKEYRSWFARSLYAKETVFSSSSPHSRTRRGGGQHSGSGARIASSSQGAHARSLGAGATSGMGGKQSLLGGGGSSGARAGQAFDIDQVFHSLPDYSLQDTSLPMLPGSHTTLAKAVLGAARLGKAGAVSNDPSQPGIGTGGATTTTPIATPAKRDMRRLSLSLPSISNGVMRASGRPRK